MNVLTCGPDEFRLEEVMLCEPTLTNLSKEFINDESIVSIILLDLALDAVESTRESLPLLLVNDF